MRALVETGSLRVSRAVLGAPSCFLKSYVIEDLFKGRSEKLEMLGQPGRFCRGKQRWEKLCPQPGEPGSAAEGDWDGLG